MKRQAVVRTYPYGYTTPTQSLTSYLDRGYIVVMCNTVACKNQHCLEYIIEREEDNSHD